MKILSILENYTEKSDPFKEKLKGMDHVYFLPVMLFWWLLQLAVFSVCLGWLFYVVAFCVVLDEGFNKKSNTFIFELLLAPFACPLIWWIRYFRHKEYGLISITF